MTNERLAPGDPAPDFTLRRQGQRGEPLRAARAEDDHLLYPAAITPGYTKQACDFRDSRNNLSGAGITVLGISPDPPATGEVPGQGGPYIPAVLDPGREVLKAYGAFGEKMMYGKTTVGVIRSTFVIDEDGKVEKA